MSMDSFTTAEEILCYAEEELDKAIKTGDILLYRNAADKAFLAVIVAVNAYIAAKLKVAPRSHDERRKLLRKLGREDLRAEYSDLMRTLHEDAFYEGVYDPEEVRHAIQRARGLIRELKEEVEQL